MNPTSLDVKDILVAENIGLTYETNLFVAKEPPSPANVVTIFDTPGFAPQLTMDRAERYNFPSIQIRVRNTDYATGWALIDNIKNALHGRGHETWNNTVYELIRCTVEPAMLDRDEANNVRFVTTFDIQRR